ncbi:MAG: gluconate 2-dehydrogenase subunit 3 family protein [Edaphobacter sp.]|uniref:gluconate 2-dehydrogenase subunit 3 family protein n=1 Tax=Edaphobacter sp. TaxID=1934404 RepID=UPI0023A0BAE4|nr:gluconate 2-dehydrogenase subunit 3 family protein [Edaphobacter sp.]MDE1178048.1 gluconate 2-dehydrogenase subunit 3 family protein [Edaphobacter sp.]
MNRRDVLRLLGSTAAISALPLEAISLIQTAHAQVAQAPGLKTLNPHQNETVIVISEMIIPETNTPGAKGAKVNEFIDLLLTAWYDPSDTRVFLDGLTAVDTQSRKQFGKDFTACTADQRTQMMHAMDEGAMQFATALKASPARTKVSLEQTTPPPTNFFYTMKKLTLAGYYTSEIGFEKELGKFIIPPGHEGCAPLDSAVAQ